MALIRWQPFHEMTTLRRQMDQLFDELTQARQESSDFQGINQASWLPAVEIQNIDSEIILRAELPGVEAQDLDIQVTREVVSISGERRYEKQTQEKGRSQSEFRYGKFQRVMQLPAQVHNDQVKAELKNGILTLSLPKVEAERRKVVKVSLAAAQPSPTATQEASNQSPATEQAAPAGGTTA